ncbi:hypothetical protein F4561_004005 [Lipingzhangella halophila]|uniref:Uncharacterized protein n=1 Tax=Lipingzhangella halophila TaxID=1783352 RepID=A0A7W7RJR2_9ACTN|nr:hypothetical protein [Lipingzhangella halophila]MBB4933185.1 hypothetical protein [Lipingzhangella halophila]
MNRPWEANPHTEFKRRIGQSPATLGVTKAGPECPDIWEMANGDVVVIGRDVTEAYRGRLPSGVSISPDERLVMIPRVTMTAAKREIPDA